MAAHPTPVSVVVATHNRVGLLERLLEALRAQTRPPDEVVIVDDASRDGTRALLDAASQDPSFPIRVVRRETAGGPAAAREEGWRAAAGEIIAFTDDDCEPAPAWIEAGLKVCEANPGAFVQGPTKPIPTEHVGPFSHTLSVESPDPSFPTCNMFYPRDVLEAVRGFDVETFRRGGEDCDLAWRAIAAGATAAFAPDALVHHAVIDLGPVGKLRRAAAWPDIMRAYARHDRLRESTFNHGIFWKEIHYDLALALASLALPARQPWIMVRNRMAYRYLQDIWARGRLYGGGPLLAPYYVLYDLVEITAVARASLRTGKLML